MKEPIESEDEPSLNLNEAQQAKGNDKKKPRNIIRPLQLRFLAVRDYFGQYHCLYANPDCCLPPNLHFD
jgi:hypothetical protein